MRVGDCQASTSLTVCFWCPWCLYCRILIYYESWVVPAGVASALADIMGAEFRQIIDFVKERGGCNVIKSIFFLGGSKGFESRGVQGRLLILIISISLISEYSKRSASGSFECRRSSSLSSSSPPPPPSSSSSSSSSYHHHHLLIIIIIIIITTLLSSSASSLSTLRGLHRGQKGCSPCKSKLADSSQHILYVIYCLCTHS